MTAPSGPRLRTCPVCGRTFEATRGKRYCSKACWPSRRPYADPGPIDDAPMTWEALSELLWTAARRGSVSAMAILRREMEPAPKTPKPTTIMDELARRRKER